MRAASSECRLPVSLGGESRGPNVGYPDLYRAQALATQSRPMRSHPLPYVWTVVLSHTVRLHVTFAKSQLLSAAREDLDHPSIWFPSWSDADPLTFRHRTAATPCCSPAFAEPCAATISQPAALGSQVRV